MITLHKQRLAEGFHAKVFEAFSLREEASRELLVEGKKVSLSNEYYESFVFAPTHPKFYPQKNERNGAATQVYSVYDRWNLSQHMLPLLYSAFTVIETLDV